MLKKRTQIGPRRPPKGTQVGPQIGPKSAPDPHYFFQDPLGDRLGRSGGLPGAQDPPGTPPGPPPGASREPPGTLTGTPRDASEAPGPTRDPPPGPSVNPLRGTIDDLSTFVSKDPTRPPQDSLREPPGTLSGPTRPSPSSQVWAGGIREAIRVYKVPGFRPPKNFVFETNPRSLRVGGVWDKNRYY